MSITTCTGHDLTLARWRDPDVLDEPGIALPPIPADGNPSHLAAALYQDGIRRVALSRPVDLTDRMDQSALVWSMLLLRELTSWGLVVDWQLRPGEHQLWQRLNHLYPPTDLLDQPDSERVLADWRRTFYLCKCIYRLGPGFVEVRDRRNGVLARFVIDAPEYLTAIEKLIEGNTAKEVPDAVLTEFVAEGLAGTAGDLAWWLPYRVRRWPSPSMIV